MFLCVKLVTHPQSYIETTDRRDFGGKPSQWKWGRALWWKIPDLCSVGGTRSKNSIFHVLRVPFWYSAHSLQETVLPLNQWYRWKAETLKVCLLLVWRVYDWTFRIYRPWRCWKVVTWPSWKLKICILLLLFITLKMHHKNIHHTDTAYK